jgi:hypothetical protein
MREFKSGLIKDCAKEVAEYVFGYCGEDVDIVELAEIININLGFYIDDSKSIEGCFDDFEEDMLNG